MKRMKKMIKFMTYWIKCEDCLPREPGEYLVYFKNEVMPFRDTYKTKIGYFDPKLGWKVHNNPSYTSEVLAWAEFVACDIPFENSNVEEKPLIKEIPAPPSPPLKEKMLGYVQSISNFFTMGLENLSVGKFLILWLIVAFAISVGVHLTLKFLDGVFS